MEMKEQFTKMVTEYYNSDDYKKKYGNLFKKLSNRIPGHGMFSMLYWYALEFNTPVEFDGVKIEKLYIMPYRIKQKDVDKAVSRFVVQNEFAENKDMVTADYQTGNFQKHPNLEFQIVFVQRYTKGGNHGGPGEMTEYKEGNVLDKNRGVIKLDKSYVYKKNWHVPAIGGEDENKQYEINELMDMAMKILSEG